jgi:hypothetical protein
VTDVRALLHDLAADAPRAHGEDTADRVVELHRAQDRRRLRWAGVAAAVAVVVAVVPALVARSSPADTAAVAADGEVTSLFDAPTRGSLAGDGDAVAELQSTSWGAVNPFQDAGQILTPVPSGRHVAFVGEVPGGQVWGLVVGRPGPQLAYAWFVGSPDGDGYAWRLVAFPQRTTAGLPLALVDLAGDHGPMLVVALPQEQVDLVDEPSPEAIRAASVQDGVALADVDTPDGAAAPQYEVSGAASSPRSTLRPDAFFSDDRGSFAAVAGPFLSAIQDRDTGAAVEACLVASGYLTATADGSTTGPSLPTDDDAQAFLAAVTTCREQAAAQAAAEAALAAASSAAASQGAGDD